MVTMVLKQVQVINMGIININRKIFQDGHYGTNVAAINRYISNNLNSMDISRSKIII